MMEPIRERVYLAGEALHETMWGTVGGAWESGERAADAVVRRLSGMADPAPVRTVVETPAAASVGRRGRGEPESSAASARQQPRAAGRKQRQAKPEPRRTRRRRSE
jgi:hypothetical protein